MPRWLQICGVLISMTAFVTGIAILIAVNMKYSEGSCEKFRGFHKDINRNHCTQLMASGLTLIVTSLIFLAIYCSLVNSGCCKKQEYSHFNMEQQYSHFNMEQQYSHFNMEQL